MLRSQQPGVETDPGPRGEGSETACGWSAPGAAAKRKETAGAHRGRQGHPEPLPAQSPLHTPHTEWRGPLRQARHTLRWPAGTKTDQRTPA
jgi:hypothetical protein